MMKKEIIVLSVILCLFYTVACKQDAKKADKMQDSSSKIDETVPKRVGMVIKIKEDQIEEYKRLHSDGHHGVRDLLIKYNMRNFSIFLQKLEDGNYYEFAYYEYVGSNFDEDMKQLAAEPRNIEWLKVCDSMQIPLDGFESWAEMETIFYNP